MYEHSIFEEMKFEVTENNHRFTKGLKASLENKTFRQVVAILKEETHCPIKRIVVERSINNWVKEIRVYGCHSFMWLFFDKHTRKVNSIW